jgi:glycerol-3-phosphate cytidylyltransferase
MTKLKVGYAAGVFDLFHIGHLNVIKKAKKNCDYLIVGVTTDEETYRLKSRYPLIPFIERKEIIKSLKYVDRVVPEKDSNKLLAYNNLKFDIIFKGDDQKGSEKWIKYEKEFKKKGVKIVFFKYTKSTSSTKIRKLIENELSKNE